MSDDYLKVTCPKCGVDIEYPKDCELDSTPCPQCSEVVPLFGKKGKRSDLEEGRFVAYPPASQAPSPPMIPITENLKKHSPPSARYTPLLLTMLLIVVSAGVFVLHQQAQALNQLAQKMSPPHWEYKVVACDDDVREMTDYNENEEKKKRFPSISDAVVAGHRHKGQFGLLKIKPGPEWDLCAWFIEPAANPKLILIFKRPVQ